MANGARIVKAIHLIGKGFEPIDVVTVVIVVKHDAKKKNRKMIWKVRWKLVNLPPIPYITEAAWALTQVWMFR